MQVAHFSIKEKLYQGSKYSVYRSQETASSPSYILKVLDKKLLHTSSYSTLLRNELNILNKIQSNRTVKPIDFIEDHDVLVMVLEDINGVTLKEKFKDHPIEVDHFLELAIQLTQGLADIHHQNIIHQDINPNNIIWNASSGEVQIIDFDLAAEYDFTISSMENPDKLEGTLAYISPEQTGRMNRKVDLRSDLYSLGITFYELLTGQLPFNFNDPMELIYAHLAREPKSPHLINSNISNVLSAVIIKLLSKNPEDRYQSIDGVTHDLIQFQNKKLTTSTIAEADFPGKLQIPEKLYGRENEIQQLNKTYNKVSQGTKEVLFVSGYSGVGKTVLVNEIHKSITKDRGYFLKGKFDQLQRSIPYFGFIQLLNQFSIQVLGNKEENRVQIKNNILEAVGNLGKVLTDTVPQLELIIGEQPDLPEVAGDEAKQRLVYVFQCFFRAIATPKHPLVLFIDDLQWADLSSLELIDTLVEDVQIRHIMILGAYRDNEISPSHPLTNTIEKVKKTTIEFQKLHLGNLTQQNVTNWLADSLPAKIKSESQDISTLAELIYQKTLGNPFFTTQFLKNLYEKELLSFDFSKSIWQWDINNIRKQNITDNVVQMLVEKVQTLPDEVQSLLKLAASVGNEFDIELLSLIAEEEINTIKDALTIGFKHQLLISFDRSNYQFAHDRIHQAVNSLISEKEKKPLHLKIGRLLLKNYNVLSLQKISGLAGKYLFDIVNHFNIGKELITTEDEQKNLISLNLKAGQKAKLSGAYKLASGYIITAIELLPERSWKFNYNLSLSVYNEAIITSYLCGNFEKLEVYLNLVLDSAQSIIDKAVAYEYQMLGYTAQNKPDVSAETLLKTIDLLGVDISDEENQPLDLLSQNEEERYSSLPMMDDPEKMLLLRLYAKGITSIMYTKQHLFPIVTLEMVRVSLGHGLTSDSALVYGFYASIKNYMGDIPGAYNLATTALELLDKLPNTDINRPKVIYLVCAYISAWKEHYKNVAKRLKENYQYALDVGDIEYAGYCLSNISFYLNRTDTEVKAWQKELNSIQDSATQLKQVISIYGIMIEQAVVSNLLGECRDPAYLALEVEDLQEVMQPGVEELLTYALFIRKTYIALLFNEHSNILSYAQTSEETWVKCTVPLIFLKADSCFHIPLAYLQICNDQSEEKQKELLEKVETCLASLKQWSEFGPVNFLHKYYLVQAEYYRVTGKSQEAGEFYDLAIEKAQENDYINEAGLASEMAARFYMNSRDTLAEFYFQKAWQCYRKWGAIAKVKDLEEKYPKYLHRHGLDHHSHQGTISSISSSGASGMLDVNSILKASQTLSGEVQLDRLLEKMMRILIENAGAQKALYIEDKDGALLIQSETDVDAAIGVLTELPVDESGKVPLSVINYVKNSREKLVFDNVSKNTTYSNDPYIQTIQPKSMVCYPVLKQGELSGMIYLENNSVEGAFTAARLEVLNILSSQIAISIENAELVENLEEKVKQRTEELETANEELGKSHKKITDSVNYASKIQEAVLPSREKVEKILRDYFVINQPCSTISGDFYWTKQFGDKIVVAVADCTGHGVPGALVSMLGMTFLNEVVSHQVTQPDFNTATVLDELREKVKTALSQNKGISHQQEGMDIALCVIDPSQKTVQYSGAFNPLFIIRENEVLETAADRMPIAIYPKEQPFTFHDLQIQDNDMIYLFSDGYADQLGGERKRRFGKEKFKRLLLEIYQQPMEEQKKTLMDRIEEWRGHIPQNDDMLIFGFRV